MPLFRYEALTEKGEKAKGCIDAESLEEAKGQLKKKQIFVTRVVLMEEKERLVSLSKSDQMLLFQDMAKLIQAGLPLYDTLLTLEEKYRSHPAHYVILDIGDRIKSGFSLSAAMKFHSKSFDVLICSMVGNSETIGCLDSTLLEIASMLSKQLALRKQLTAALLYPAILLSFCTIVIVALLFFVVPSLFPLLEGRTLHPLTRIVLSCSQFANSHMISIGAIFFSFVFFLFLSFRLEGTKKRIKYIWVQMPIFKGMLERIALIRFCRTFSSLLQGGVSYVIALRLATQVMQHPYLEKEMEKVQNAVMEGGRLSELLKRSRRIPELIPRMLSIAEQGGNLPQMLLRIAEFYESELDRSLSRLSVILQPVLLLILGGIIGFVVLSVLLPLTDVSSFVSG
ncbi:MAG: type II secretion system F family protein [Chlamydiota bacterium]